MSAPGIITCAPDGTSDRRHLGMLGTLSAITWSSTLPGGDDQFSAVLTVPKLYREPAIQAGRILQVIYAGSVVYEGRLDRPAPVGDSGWSLAAHGSGTYGDDYRAVWTSYTAANILSAAIGRGLRWNVGTVTGGNLGQVSDTASQSVTQFLNAYADTVSLTWQVNWQGNTVSVFPVPSAVTRLLVTTTPAAADLADYVNALYVRYQSSAAGVASPAYGLTSSTLPASITAHGRTEDYWDLSASGQLSSAAAAGSAAGALAKYVSASFSQSFTVRHGQYLTRAGTAVDLAAEHAGEVVQLIVAASGFGGEIGPVWPVTFPAGAVSYDNDAGTLAVTPYQSVKSNFSGLLGLLAPPPRKPAPRPPARKTVPRRK